MLVVVIWGNKDRVQFHLPYRGILGYCWGGGAPLRYIIVGGLNLPSLSPNPYFLPSMHSNYSVCLTLTNSKKLSLFVIIYILTKSFLFLFFYFLYFITISSTVHHRRGVGAYFPQFLSFHGFYLFG